MLQIGSYLHVLSPLSNTVCLGIRACLKNAFRKARQLSESLADCPNKLGDEFLNRLLETWLSLSGSCTVPNSESNGSCAKCFSIQGSKQNREFGKVKLIFMPRFDNVGSVDDARGSSP